MLDKALRSPIRLVPKKHDPEDPYAYKLYELEKTFVGTCIYHSCPKYRLAALAEDASHYYNLDPPELHIVNRPKLAQYGWTEKSAIYINKAHYGNTAATLYHELSHMIIHEYFDESVESHGPEFLGVYMHLLDKYRIMPHEAFRLLARKWGLKIHHHFRPGAICSRRS